MEHEYSVDVPPLWEGDKPIKITVDKVGGGTLGASYAGSWDVQWFNVAKMADEVLTTGTPKTHAEVARIYADFLSAYMDTDEDRPLADRLSYWAAGVDSDDNEE